MIMKRITFCALLMTLFLLLSCGSGSAKTEDPKTTFLNSIISLSNDFLNVFTSFTDMVGGVLGFNTNTKKSDVGNYFKTVQDTVQGTKDKLNKIVADMKSDNNPNSEATDTAVKALITNTLDKIIQGAKTASEAIGTTGDELLGNVAAANAAGVAGTEVDKLVKGIKSIVDVVLGDKGNSEAGTVKKPMILEQELLMLGMVRQVNYLLMQLLLMILKNQQQILLKLLGLLLGLIF
ncbi:Variable outer membrane protein (plasmid) [Borrelia parkeri SLO]|uniref:Variable large protein n=1 Tax=Borrelia parkeri SLO TaxID=1313294 RepID=W5SYI6_BORPR|nr:Variable outer membrane protein [Borrelia parkeri SLO]